MSAAATVPTVCGCGCGRDTKGHGRFLNGRHREQFEAAQTFPRYTSAETRLEKCLQHGAVYEQRRCQFEGNGQIRIGAIGTGGARPQFSAAAAAVWLGSCPDCAQAERERIEGLKPKPASACAERTCQCPAPKCPDCGRAMAMGPGSLGFHSWLCCDVAFVEDIKAETGITAKPFVLTGTHRKEILTAWRDHV